MTSFFFSSFFHAVRAYGRGAIVLLFLLSLQSFSANGVGGAIVTSVSPAKNALDISPTTTIQVTFSGAMLTTSFNDTTSFIVSGITSGRHRGTFVFSGGNTIATFTPTVAFKKGEMVVVDLTSNLKDVSNVALMPLVYSFTVMAANSPGTFAAKVDYAAGGNTFSVFVSDVDGDGDGDLAVAALSLNAVSIYKNNGDGTFAAKVDYTTGTAPVFVFVGDLDGDGDGDLATANANAASISILMNNGDGTFAAKTDYTTGSSPNYVFISDLDGDGDGDLAVANYSSFSVSIFKNNGDGTFAARVNYTAGNNPSSVFVSDVDGDGDGDLAVANRLSHTVSIYKNNGDGTFAAKVDYATGTQPYTVVVSDLDSDGDGDLAVTAQTADAVSILKNNGDGTFAAKVDYATGDNPFPVFASDVDGDGDDDLAVANANSGNVSILKNNGDGTFAAKTDYTTGSAPYSVFVSDIDGNGTGDILTANRSSNTVSVLKGDAIPQHTLTVNSENGTVVKNPDQTDFVPGSTVILTATPDRGYLFTGWSGDASGMDNPLTVTMDGDKVIQANYEVHPDFEILYRTAKYETWAKAKDGKGALKSYKRKADKVFFKYNLTVASASNILYLEFPAEATGAITNGKSKLDTLTTFSTTKKKYRDTLETVTAGDTIQIEGIAKQGKKVTVKYAWGTAKAVTMKADSLFKVNRVGLPMPNLVNVGEELFPVKNIQTGYYSKLNPLVVGVPQGEKKANSVTHLTYQDVQKSLIKIIKKLPALHSDTLAARCLDSLDGKTKKPMDKQQKSLPPDKMNNKLFAEVLTLKLNIAASATEKFPAGFGQLTFDDPSDVGNHFNGMSVDSIVIQADSILSCVQSEIDVTPGELYGVIRKINIAFADTTIDTLSFGSKTKLTGVKSLFEVDYLHPTEGAKPRIVQSLDVAGEQPEEFALYQNYPNPFNPSTVISYSLSVNSVVTLKVYNLLGQEVATLLNKQEMEAGDYELPFNAINLPSGVYFYRINVESVDEDGMKQSFTDVKRMLMMK